MADQKLELLRKLYREENEKKNGQGRTFSGDNASYPFWNIPEQTIAVVRFLPDADDNNSWWWAERQTIQLPFAGVIGGESPTENWVKVTVPCVDMFEKKTCPIIQFTNPWWDIPAKKETARKYYKKRSFITQGFVISSPFEEQSVPENPIRRFMLGVKIQQKLQADAVDLDRDYVATDFLNGYDFRIRKTKTGDGRNDYSTSSLALKSRPLTESEMLAIDQYKLFNLSDFRGARPDADGVAAIFAMFQASLRGDPYDFDAFGKYYRPYGAGTPAAASDEVSVAPVDMPLDDDEPVSVLEAAPVTLTTAAASGVDSKDIVARLRERNAKRG
jgi:hypothetical protein